MPAKKPTPNDKSFLTAHEMMPLLKYKDPSSFWLFVRRSGIPHLRLNARRILFDPAAVEAWLRKKAIGTHDAPLIKARPK